MVLTQKKKRTDALYGVEGTCLEVVEVIPGYAPTPLPIHFANHGLAIGVPESGLTEMNHRSLERVSVDVI